MFSQFFYKRSQIPDLPDAINRLPTLLTFGAQYRRTDRQTNRRTDRQTNRRTDRQTNRRTDRQTDGQTYRRTDRQTNRRTDIQTDRQTDKQTDRHTDKQTDRQTNGGIPTDVTITCHYYCTIYSAKNAPKKTNKSGNKHW